MIDKYLGYDASVCIENLPSDVIKIEMLLKPRDPFICDMARDCL
jgi:hypothetical protein